MAVAAAFRTILKQPSHGLLVMNPRLAMVARRFQKNVMMLEAQSRAFRRQLLRYQRMVAGTDYERHGK